VRKDQAFLSPPDMRDWLPPEHPAWLVITVVEDHLDTGVSHAARKTGGAGTVPGGPALLRSAHHHRDTSSFRHTARRADRHQAITPAIEIFSSTGPPAPGFRWHPAWRQARPATR
jgi:hypothetical protein